MDDRHLGIENPSDRPRRLRINVAGGGPVGLAFALLVESLMGDNVLIDIYDRRWIEVGTEGSKKVAWKDQQRGNSRRQQVVTIQSRQYTKLPESVQARLFACPYTEMWPTGTDSPQALGAPRNLRISDIEDSLLDLANDSRQITLYPVEFDPTDIPDDCRILAICEGAQSRTREHFSRQFGAPDQSVYSVSGDRPLIETVLGLRVKSDLPDPMAVVLTAAQNRFLLNTLAGDGFLNMRLTPPEIKEVIGMDKHYEEEFFDCIQSSPCMMVKQTRRNVFECPTHGSIFKPAVDPHSFIWRRILDGLKLFGVKEDNLTGITAFRLEMVQRPRFTAQLRSATSARRETFGFLLGDAANAIHIWPGRGLNSGLVSALSLARCIHNAWEGKQLRDADFLLHEATMGMLQYRHKTRAWRQMVVFNPEGSVTPIYELIRNAKVRPGVPGRQQDIETLENRTHDVSLRLRGRLAGDPKLPGREDVRKLLQPLRDQTLRALVESGPWDTWSVAGDEVDVDRLLPPPVPGALSREPRGSQASSAAASPSISVLQHRAPRKEKPPVAPAGRRRFWLLAIFVIGMLISATGIHLLSPGAVSRWLRYIAP